MVVRAGSVLAILQFAFALTWVVYSAYLPSLAAQSGVPASWVPWILVADQLIFVVCDWAAGVFADRLGDFVVRLARWMAVITLASCVAFLALPMVAPLGSPPVFLALIAIWSVTSSMLRAPPLVLAGRYATRPQRAGLAALYVFGIGAAGAVAPYAGQLLAATDPRLPFAATSIVLGAMALVLGAVATQPAPMGLPSERARPIPRAAFAIAMVLLAIGFQVHSAIASVPLYLRHAPRERLVELLPVFWIGFNLAALPVAVLVRRVSGLAVATVAALLGAGALLVANVAGSLDVVVMAQAAAGVGWGGVLGGAFAAATVHDRRPGGALGLAFSMLAAAAAARIAVVASVPDLVEPVRFVPPIAWALGALVVGTFAFKAPRPPVR